MRSAVLMGAYLLGKKFSYQPNLIVGNKCSVSRLGYISHITDQKLLNAIKKYLFKTNKIMAIENKVPDFCKNNASKVVLENLINLSK